MTATTALSAGTRAASLVVAGAFFMEMLDASILNTSLPQMAGSFGVRPIDLSIGVTAYLIAVAAGLPVSGWLASRFGARTVFAAALATFATASLACGLATSLPIFVAARIVQGLAGALMTPVGRAIAVRHAGKAELVGVTALMTWPALLAPVIGPVLGGFLTTYASWRWNFLINVPLGALGVAAVMSVLPRDEAGLRPSPDWPGAALSAFTLILVLGGLEAASNETGAAVAGAAIVAGLLVGVMTWRYLRVAPQPIVGLGVLQVRTFSMTTIGAGMAYRTVVSATPFLVPLLLQLGLGMSAAAAGLRLLVYFAGNLAMKTVTTPILRLAGFRAILVGNGLLGAGALAGIAAIRPATPEWLLALLLLIAGMTRSMQFTAVNSLVYADVAPEERAAASTISSVAMQVAMSLGVALAALAVELARRAHGHTHVGLSDITPAFLALGGCAGIAALRFLMLDRNAGHEVSGHVARARAGGLGRQTILRRNR